MKMKVSEPAVAYNAPYLQSLKNRIIASLDTTTDERKLQECLVLLHADEMPGIYSDEEFAEVMKKLGVFSLVIMVFFLAMAGGCSKKVSSTPAGATAAGSGAGVHILHSFDGKLDEQR